MEAHKPKLVRNWREFLKEYAIIVIGVLTALLAEQAVQAIEWRHKVEAAIADMTQEMETPNGGQAYARLAIHDCLESRLAAIRAAVESGDRSQSRKLIDTIWLPNKTYDSLARERATASDVASHMPADEMIHFRIVYAQIADLDRLADKELGDLAHLRALPATGGPLQQSEKLAETSAIEELNLDNDRMARDARFTLRHMRIAGLQLDRKYLAQQIGDARAHYGRCLSVPDGGAART
jgi:hypothetical protein